MSTPRHDRAEIDPARIRRRLLRWFDAHRRDLPWRRTTDPYAVWVSEVMLQQTQVDRVVGYFVRFLDRFPNVHALASAPIDDVLKSWEGLGYYGRARSLHRAARVLVDTHDGALPSTAEALKTLPGFGRYTAGAVASIAFGRREPAVDTNVHRVVSRLARIDGTTSDPEARRTVDVSARALVRCRRPGDVNQALMDLGSAICRPRKPRCGDCPLRDLCAAMATGNPERWPAARPRPTRTVVREVRVAIARRGRLLVVRRPEAGLLGGLWELPGVAVALDTDDDAVAVELHAAIARRTGLDIEMAIAGDSFRLSFSHLELDVAVRHAVVTGGRLRRGTGRWVTLDYTATLPLTRATRRVLGQLKKGHGFNGSDG